MGLLHQFAKLLDQPCVTKDGVEINLQMNAGLLMDLPQLEQTGAQGIGLFRTELQFLVSATLPKADEHHPKYQIFKGEERCARQLTVDRPMTTVRGREVLQKSFVCAIQTPESPF